MRTAGNRRCTQMDADNGERRTTTSGQDWCPIRFRLRWLRGQGIGIRNDERGGPATRQWSTATISWPLTAVCCLLVLGGSLYAEPTVQITDEVVVAEGETYKIELSKEKGEFSLFAKDADGNWQGLVCDGGERFWYGLNLGGGEARTSQHKPDISIVERDGVTVIETVCRVNAEFGIIHRGAYALRDRWVLCRSQLLCEELPQDAHILRIGPRCDASTERFSSYAFRDEKDKLHAGAIAKLGEPDQYVGVRSWGRQGDVARDLSPTTPYLSLHNPDTGAHIAFVYPMYERFWGDKHIFLQVYHDERNYLYTAYADRGAFGGEFPFCIYADNTGGPQQLEEALPAILGDAELLIETGVTPIRALTLEKETREALDALLPGLEAAWRRLEGQSRTDEIARRLWLSRRLWRQANLAVRATQFEASLELAREAAAVP